MQDTCVAPGSPCSTARFGSPCSTARSSAAERQAKSVAAHIAKTRRASAPNSAGHNGASNVSIPANRINPLLGGHSRESGKQRPQTPLAKMQRAGHLRTPSFEKETELVVGKLFCGAATEHRNLQELDDLEESTEEEMSTLAGSPCTELKARVGALCDKAESLVQEMSSVMTPPTPPRTSLCPLPFQRLNASDSSPKQLTSKAECTPNNSSSTTLKMTCTPNSSSFRTDDFPSLTPVSSIHPGTPVRGREEMDDLRFRVSLLDLELSKVRNAHDPSMLNDDLASLKKTVEDMQEQMKEVREEVRETKLQMAMLALQTNLQRNMPSPSSGSPSVSRQNSVLDGATGQAAACLQTGCSQMAQKPLRHRPSAPAIMTTAGEHAAGPPRRARSIDALSRRRLFNFPSAPVTPQCPARRSISQERPTQQQLGANPPGPARDTRPQTARRVRSSDQFLQGPARKPLMLRGILEPALTSRDRRSAKPWRQAMCSRMASANSRS